jgi:hypothetical protein
MFSKYFVKVPHGHDREYYVSHTCHTRFEHYSGDPIMSVDDDTYTRICMLGATDDGALHFGQMLDYMKDDEVVGSVYELYYDYGGKLTSK